jgi:glycosyltransferase involved in cell wall biosynthesis
LRATQESIHASSPTSFVVPSISVNHVGIEVGDLLRPHRAGMARYTASLISALAVQGHADEVQAWARWRRAFGWFARPPEVKLHFFGERPPKNRPAVFHAAACVFPRWESPVEIATVHDLWGIRKELQLSPDEVQRRTAYIRRAHRIICVSNYTRNHLHELLDIPSSRTVAIPLTAASSFVPASEESKRDMRRRFHLPQEFLLFVGRDRLTKNLDRLVAAYALSRLTMPLCIAGRQSKQTHERLLRLAHEHRCAGSIRWLGTVRDADLPVLLSCASALCFPSIFEGFGLPVIEAMACGTPVVTSAGRATEEAAGGKAVLVDPESIESIAEGLPRALQMTEAQRADARTHATRRTWADVAKETWQVYMGAIETKEQPTPIKSAV